MMYFDYASTTPVAPQVRDAMLPYLSDVYFNASGLYDGGKAAHEAVETARRQLRELLKADEGCIVFTSGGTEADNLAVIGTAMRAVRTGNSRRRILCSAVEHHAVLESCEFLRQLGFTVDVLPVDTFGRVLPETLERAVGDDVLLVSVMWVNNELGTIEDIPGLADIAHSCGAYFHTDAVQALSSQNVDVSDCGADMVTISAHKIYGPMGAGALWLKREGMIDSIQHGGQQEAFMRGGTENVPAIVGFGAAAQLLMGRREADARLMAENKRRLISLLSAPFIRINSPSTQCAPGVLNVAFRDIEAEGMLFFLNMEGIYLSMGSACNSRSVEPSHVIRAIGLPEEYARGCIRISLGRDQTTEMIDTVAARLLSVAQQMRS